MKNKPALIQIGLACALALFASDAAAFGGGGGNNGVGAVPGPPTDAELAALLVPAQQESAAISQAADARDAEARGLALGVTVRSLVERAIDAAQSAADNAALADQRALEFGQNQAAANAEAASSEGNVATAAAEAAANQKTRDQQAALGDPMSLAHASGSSGQPVPAAQPQDTPSMPDPGSLGLNSGGITPEPTSPGTQTPTPSSNVPVVLDPSPEQNHLMSVDEPTTILLQTGPALQAVETSAPETTSATSATSATTSATSATGQLTTVTTPGHGL